MRFDYLIIIKNKIFVKIENTHGSCTYIITTCDLWDYVRTLSIISVTPVTP